MCEFAREQSGQAIYNWQGIRDGDAGGDHRENIDDGELCSAGSERYAPYDEPGDWPSTTIEPGTQTFTLDLTAPHEAKYFRFYMTKDGWNPDTALAWDDLELIHETDPMSPTGTTEISGVDVPDRNNKEHIIYMVWQRSDSPEAFYSCSYVDVAGADDGNDDTPDQPDTPTDTPDQPDTPTDTPDQPDVPAWDSGAAYTSGDQVTYNGKTWEAKWWTQGDEPGSSEWGPWEQVSGDDTPDQPDTPTDTPTDTPDQPDTPTDTPDQPDVPEWNSSTAYTSGDQVSYDGETWEATWWTQGDEPGSSQWGPWERVE
ncbi:Chitin-binding protein [Halomicrobium sp. LC1Hm]|nr:Chitin-binding protein [Halomicrobium sp. LC1Hm]